MRKSKIPALAKAIEMTAERGVDSLPDSLFAVIADRLERAIGSRERRQLEELQQDLSAFVDAASLAIPESVHSDLRSEQGGDASAAFTLGRISFAQLVASRAFGRRADSQFMEALTDTRFAKYIHALSSGPKNGTALEKASGEATATVSRKMAILRSLGIIEVHRDGNFMVNTLTPAALAIVRALPASTPAALNSVPTAATKELAAMRQSVPYYLRSPAHFSPGSKARRGRQMRDRRAA